MRINSCLVRVLARRESQSELTCDQLCSSRVYECAPNQYSDDDFSFTKDSAVVDVSWYLYPTCTHVCVGIFTVGI